jgi:hypothetical protein
LGAPLSVRLQGCARAQSQPQGQQWRVGSTASQRSDLRPECAKSGHARRSAERSCRSQILPSNIGSGRSFGLGRSQPMYNQRVPAGFCVNLRDAGGRAISETRKIAAILVPDVVGYSRLVGAEEGSHPGAAQGTAQRSDRSDHLRPLRPRRQAHRRRLIVEFRSVVDAVRCAIEGQNDLIDRNVFAPYAASRVPPAPTPSRPGRTNSAGQLRVVQRVPPGLALLWHCWHGARGVMCVAR